MTAGRCELCNKLLFIDSNFGDDANYAEEAHIHAVSSTGPRHKDDMTKEEINQIENLMLLCAEHHHLIDTKPEKYPGDYLKRKKAEHEARIRRLTDIRDDSSCKMVTYFSNIDNVDVFGAAQLLRRAVVKDGMYPKQEDPISLSNGIYTKYFPSKEKIQQQAEELKNQVNLYFGSIVKKEERVAVFALAPQPLLMKLGTLLCDQLNVVVYQCHRQGDKWAWPDDSSKVDFVISKTLDNSKSTIALVIDLSAEIVDSRVTAVLGSECTIYHLTTPEPNRLFVKNRDIQDEFVRMFRIAMENLKNEFPSARKIHVFPAMPQSLAIRAGMDYMPKADLPLLIYEQVNTDVGFIETITIGD